MYQTDVTGPKRSFCIYSVQLDKAVDKDRRRFLFFFGWEIKRTEENGNADDSRMFLRHITTISTALPTYPVKSTERVGKDDVRTKLFGNFEGCTLTLYSILKLDNTTTKSSTKLSTLVDQKS